MIGKSSRIDVRDEGASQGYAQTFNFAGAGVVATVSGTIATITIAGGGAGSPEGSYAPGSYTIATGKFRNAVKQQQFTTTQRLTIQGTGRLSMQN